MTPEQQIIEGKRLVVEKANILAQENGINIENTEWKPHDGLVYNLSLTANNKTVMGGFLHMWLADYPAQSSPEANAMISEMIFNCRK